MNEITAPYGFVPLASKVVTPEWAQPIRLHDGRVVAPPLHDVPFEDGISGTLQLTVHAETPLFTRGVGDRPFALPDERYAIPGTTLRGVLRNIVEIIGFGHMADRVNDHRYAVRDLHNARLYGQFMAGIVCNPRTGKQEPMPLVNAGWLCRRRDCDRDVGDDDEGCYEIELCDFAKIEYRYLSMIAARVGPKQFDPCRKQSAAQKYKAWGSASRQVGVIADFRRPNQVNGRVLLSQYGVVTAAAGNRQGTLVFTGQPTNYRPGPSNKKSGGNAKHHDFVFFPAEKPRRLPVDEAVFRDFVFAHSDRGQQNSLGRSETPNEEWGYWFGRLSKNPEEKVPVFFLTDDAGNTVKAFGLAMMFRLPYRYSVREAVGHVQPQGAGPVVDLADAMFGTVQGGRDRDELGAFALKGRVSFSHAIAQGEVQPSRAVFAVLGQPRASYYPNYVEQSNDIPGALPPQDEDGKAVYTTWQDHGVRPRGWKRYRPLTKTFLPEPPTGADGRPLSLERVGTRFCPLPAGTRFVSTVYLHNVRPEELGALVWAMDFGGNQAARHTIGMGRPLGFGRCRLTLEAKEPLRTAAGAVVDLPECRKRFEAYMEKEIRGWRQTAPIRELVALAQPVDPARARYQRLDPGRRVNEFVDAKRDGLALLPADAGLREQAQRRGRVVGTARTGTSVDVARGGAGRSVGGRPANRDRAVRPAPAAGPVTRQGWPGKKRGETLKVRLVELNRKGKWRCEVVGYQATGVIEGTAPADAAAGATFDVEVIQGSDPKNLNLKWKG